MSRFLGNISAPLTMDRVVLDTNCLLASISKRGQYFGIWEGLQRGTYTLCVSNEILEEYHEIIGRKTDDLIAMNIIQTLLNSPNVELITPYYHFRLIEVDPDDNKFVDCAIAANAIFIVSEDSHFKVLQTVKFPKITVIRLRQFLEYLQKL